MRDLGNAGAGALSPGDDFTTPPGAWRGEPGKGALSLGNRPRALVSSSAAFSSSSIFSSAFSTVRRRAFASSSSSCADEGPLRLRVSETGCGARLATFRPAHASPPRVYRAPGPQAQAPGPAPGQQRGPVGLMDEALVFGTKDCRYESCQGHADCPSGAMLSRRSFEAGWPVHYALGESAAYKNPDSGYLIP